MESWGVRRGGGWGGASCAGTIARACAPLAAHAHAGLRTAALCLLAKLLPAVPDPTPGKYGFVFYVNNHNIKKLH